MNHKTYLKGFKWGNPKYQRAHLPQNDWASAVLTHVEVPDNARVCVVAPANGELVQQLATRLSNGFLLVLEFDDTLFKKSLRNPLFAHTQRAMLFKADPCALPSNLPKGPFDLLVAHRTTERCQNQTRTISRYIRLVKEGGAVYCEMAGRGDLADLRKAADALKTDPEFAIYFKDFRFGYALHDKVDLEGHMVAAGYAQYTLNLREEERRIPLEEFAEWLLTIGASAHAAALPKGVHESFAAKVADQLDCTDEGVLISRTILSGHGHRMWGDLSHDLMNSPVGSL